MLVLAVFLTGCTYKHMGVNDISYPYVEEDGTDTETEEKKFLAYNSASELSPFANRSQINMQIIALMYDSLFTLDDSFKPVNSICSGYVGDGAEYLLAIREDVFFSGGSRLTSEDVRYSIEMYRATASAYRERVAGIETVEIISDRIVKIALNEPDNNFMALMTMPIVKSGTGEDSIPEGSGKYVLKEYGSSYKLIPNDVWHGDKDDCGEIELYPIISIDELFYGAASGSVSRFEADLNFIANSVLYKTGFNINAVDTTSMNYIGINFSNRMLADKRIRQIISEAVDRQRISEQIYGGFAVDVCIPVHPDAYFISEDYIEYEQLPFQELLSAAGFDDKNVREQTLSVLVNRDNTYKRALAEYISEVLNDIGINTEVEAVSFNEYLDRLSTGRFDLYIAETMLTANFDISAVAFGELDFGGWSCKGDTEKLIQLWETAKSMPEDDMAVGYGAFYSEFLKELPFIPLCFEKRIAVSKK